MLKELKHKYSDNLSNKKILIIGPYPPPMGGVSIHIKRVKIKLDKQKNKVFIFDTSQKFSNKISSFIALFKKISHTKPDIIYYHEPSESIQKFAFVTILRIFFRSNLTIIDHDCRFLYKCSKIKKPIFNFLTKQSDFIVLIGDSTYKCYLDNKINIIKKISVESPFLQPNLSEEKIILNNYPKLLHEFLKSHQPIISANAFTPVLIDGKDLYGFDMSIELIKELKKIHQKIGIVWAICKEGDRTYFESIKQKIKNFDLKKNFYFLIGNQEFWPIIKNSDLFIRPTLSDGHSVSVKEADFLSIPILASDICLRSKNTILFKSESISDLTNKSIKILSKIKEENVQIPVQQKI